MAAVGVIISTGSVDCRCTNKKRKEEGGEDAIILCSSTQLLRWVLGSRTVGLAERLQDLDVHGREDPAQNLADAVSFLLVTGVDGASLPVGPVQSLPGQR